MGHQTAEHDINQHGCLPLDRGKRLTRGANSIRSRSSLVVAAVAGVLWPTHHQALRGVNRPSNQHLRDTAPVRADPMEGPCTANGSIAEARSGRA